MGLCRTSNLSVLALGSALLWGSFGCTTKYTDDDFGLAKDDGNGAGGAGGAGMGGDGTGGDGTGGNGMGGGAPNLPGHGLVVLGGVDSDDRGVLSVLDPESGEQLARNSMPDGVRVAAIAHDGAPDRDLWFVFTAGSFPANPSVPANLQVRRFDEAQETWTTLTTVTNLPPPLPGSLTVLNRRLAYISFVVEGGEIVQSVTLLDTTDPEDVKQIDFDFPTSDPNDGEALVGLVGVRGTEEDANSPGGTLNLTIGVGATIADGRPHCETTCDIEIQSIAVGSLIQAGLRAGLGASGGPGASDVTSVPLTTLDSVRRDVLVVVPGANAENDVHLYRVPDPRNTAVTEFESMPLTSEELVGFAVAECARVAAFASSAGTIEGVSRVGLKRTVELGRPGQLLTYEPYTRALISPYNPGDAMEEPVISAFDVMTNTSGTNLTIEPRAAWDAPDDLRVDVLAVRSQVPPSCE